MKDALGNEIVLGTTYGYYRRSNGHVKVVIGKAVRFTAYNVSLEVIQRGSAIYSEEIKADEGRKTASVCPNSIFPIDNNINW